MKSKVGYHHQFHVEVEKLPRFGDVEVEPVWVRLGARRQRPLDRQRLVGHRHGLNLRRTRRQDVCKENGLGSNRGDNLL